jgi:cytochrome P450
MQTLEAIPHLDHQFWSPDYCADQDGCNQQWLAEVPIWWSDRLGGAVVVRYEDVRRVLNEPAVFGQSPIYDGAFVDAFSGPSLPALDPPEHASLRKIVAGHFRIRMVEANFSEAIRRIVVDIVEGFSSNTIEIYADFTDKLVARVAAVLIGGDMGDPERLAAYNAAVIRYMRRTRERKEFATEQQDGKQAGDALIAYLSDLYDERARVDRGQSDLLTVLSHTNADKADAVRMAALSLVAGVDTTVRGIANSLFALLSHPDQLAKVRAQPSLADKAFAEALRWMTPISLKHRYVRAETELCGVRLRAGDHACVILGAANRDPRVYDQPERYDVDRVGPAHVAFGSGIHYCLGAPLATLEARHSLQVLLEQFPRLSADTEAVVFSDGPANHSPERLVLDLGR